MRRLLHSTRKHANRLLQFESWGNVLWELSECMPDYGGKTIWRVLCGCIRAENVAQPKACGLRSVTYPDDVARTCTKRQPRASLPTNHMDYGLIL